MNSAAVDICLQVFGWTHIFVYPECVPRGGIAGSRSNSVSNILRDCQPLLKAAAPFTDLKRVRVRYD